MGRIPPKGRLAALLKQNSGIPAVRAFREQCRDMYRLGGVLGLDHWIEARFELGLITDPTAVKAAIELQGILNRIIDEAIEALTPRPAIEPS